MIRSFDAARPRIATGVFVAPSADVIGDTTLAEEVSIWYGCVLRGDVHPIFIGARANIQDLSVIHVTSGKYATRVGADVTVGHRCLLHGCSIGDRVLVGMGAIIMDGAQIGADSIVAAGALVPPGKSYPPGVLIKGSPATVARETTIEERAHILQSARNYVELARRHILGCNPVAPAGE